MKGEKQNMNKLFTKIAKLTLGLAMAAGVGVAVSGGVKESAHVEAAAGDTYERISSASDLSAGDYIVFVNQAETYACGTTQNTNNRTPVTVTISNHAFTKGASDNIQEFKLVAGATSGQYGLHTGSGYYKSNSSTKNNTTTDSVAESTTPSGTQLWTFSVSNYVFSVTNVTNTSYYLAFNSTTYFSQYKQGQSKPYIYKKAASHTITFNANGGSGTVPTAITGSGSKTLPSSASLTKTGYTLDGWGDSSHKDNASAQYALGASYTLSDDITLYAHWTANKYDISYYDQGGGTFSGSHESGYPTKHTYGTATTLKSATKGGHSFDGWFTTSACTGSAVTSLGATAYTAAISLYAKWTATGTTYSISTTVTNGTYSGDTTITDNGGVASVTISPTGDYKLPTSVSVSGASHTYNATTGVISLSGATGDVTISAAMVALTEYSITVNETNGSHTGASTIKESRTASLTFTPASGYGQPSSVTVSGATSSWTRGTGVLSLSNPTGNVTVTYTAVGNELDSISISTNSGSYTLGDNFVMPTVTAKYTINADADVTSSASYSGYDPYTTGSQPVTISYTEGGITKTQSYTATVSAKSVGHSYNKISSVSDIVEGDYILAYSTYAFDGRDANNGYTTVTITSDSISGTAAMDKLALHITPVTGGYTLQVSSTSDNNASKYLGFTSGSNSISFNANAVTIASQTVSSSTHYTYASGGAFTFGDSSTVLSWNNNSSNLRYRFYKTSTTSDSTNGKNYYAFDLYKKVESGAASLIRITAAYNGGEKYVGDSISTSDFTVQKQLDTSATLSPVASGYTISANTLTAESNSITVSYTEGNITKTYVVVVPATPRSVTLVSVELVQGENVVKEYVDWSDAEWDFTDLSVRRTWSDASTELLDLADLVESEDASVSPAKPAVGVSSFTVSYEYLSVSITNASVTGISVVADYVESVSWGDKSLSHFKAFSGEQLTSTTVSGWTVKATYAGAGETNALSFGTGANQFTIRIGDSKAVTSLPYTWTTADDNQFVYVVVGGVAKGDSTHAKTNICATINAIDHEETVSGLLDKTATWTKEQSAAIYDSGSNLTELCENGVDIDANIHMQGDSTAGSTAIRFWSDGIRCYNGNKLTFTPKNGAVITKITFASTGISFADGVTDNTSSPFTINEDYGDSAITLSFSLSSTVKMGSDVVVEYQIEGSESTTVHYANDMEHFDAQKKVVEFAKFMNTTMNGTNVCSGTFANLESAWDDVAGKYDELFGASTTLNETELAWAKNMLKYATAAWGSDDEAAFVEKAMKTYEHCVSQYDLDEFMSAVRSAQSVKVSPLVNIIGENTNTVAIIVIISMVSVTAIGGYFFLRRRKENI